MANTENTPKIFGETANGHQERRSIQDTRQRHADHSPHYVELPLPVNQRQRNERDSCQQRPAAHPDAGQLKVLFEMFGQQCKCVVEGAPTDEPGSGKPPHKTTWRAIVDGHGAFKRVHASGIRYAAKPAGAAELRAERCDDYKYATVAKSSPVNVGTVSLRQDIASTYRGMAHFYWAEITFS